MNYLVRLPYPGNVRQLKNMVERAVLMCVGNRIEKSDFEFLGEEQATIPASVSGATLEDLEKTAITEALQKYDGNL